MPEQDHNAGELDEPQIVFRMVLVPHHQTAEVVKPSEESLNFPAPLESAQCSAILCLVLWPAVLLVRCNHLGTKLVEHLRIQPIAVVTLVADQAFRHVGHESLLHRLGHQLHFSRASTLCAYG